MKIPIRRRDPGVSFNITPLIDVVFLLIIFFLAASHLARTDAQDTIELPIASQAEDDEQKSPRRLVITITADAAMRVGQSPVNLQQWEQMLIAEQLGDESRPLEIRIRSDRHVAYGVVEPLLLACARAGITDVAFNVVPE